MNTRIALGSTMLALTAASAAVPMALAASPAVDKYPTKPIRLIALPTLAESGLRGYEVDQWYGFITSAKVPRPLVDRLAAAIAEGVKSSDTAQRLSAEGSTPVGSSPEEFGAHIKSEIAKWRKLVKDAALVLNQ